MSDNQIDNSDAWIVKSASGTTPKAIYAYTGPMPDCSTCRMYRLLAGPWCDISGKCIAGDQYRPMPPVRLWRTK